jgi:hypothetical protein
LICGGLRHDPIFGSYITPVNTPWQEVIALAPVAASLDLLSGAGSSWAWARPAYR